MIISNRNHMFGTGQVGVLKNDQFRCIVSTAPEGFFKGCSTIILTFQGEWGQQSNQKVVTKALLHPRMGKARRIEFHRALLADLDALGSRGFNLTHAVDHVFKMAKEDNFVVDFVSQTHSATNNDGAPDSMQASIEGIVETQGREIEAECQRLLTIIRETAQRIGEPPLTFVENGETLVHPDLVAELKKPGNESLRDLLIRMARGDFGSVFP